jgi:hypothetical protein
MPSVFNQFETALKYLGVESGPIAWKLANAGIPDKDLVDFLDSVTASQVSGTGVKQ